MYINPNQAFFLLLNDFIDRRFQLLKKWRSLEQRNSQKPLRVKQTNDMDDREDFRMGTRDRDIYSESGATGRSATRQNSLRAKPLTTISNAEKPRNS